jgi:hypothetical protein
VRFGRSLFRFALSLRGTEQFAAKWKTLTA